MSAGRHVFDSAVVQVPTGQSMPRRAGCIPVIVYLYKETRFWFDGPDDYESDGPLTFVATEEFLDTRERMSQIVAAKLLLMPIPEEEVPAIIEKLVQKLSMVSDVPSHMPITVLIFDITVSLLGSADYDHVIDWIATQPFWYYGLILRGGEVIEESIASYKANLTPATRSFVHGLKKFRLDSLEEAVVRDQTPTCAICLKDFAESVEEEELITFLPCKHHYHVNCIVLWLEINHVCPLCRCPMPTVEAGEPLTEATAN
ncbi:hypothetical protein ACLB2K_012445 [Fragaria x ananassa]